MEPNKTLVHWDDPRAMVVAVMEIGRRGMGRSSTARAVAALFGLALAMVVGGCSPGASGGGTDGSMPGGGGGDGSISVDGGPATAARPGREIVSGGGRVRAGTLSMDLQLGHWTSQRKMTAGTRTLEG